MKGKTIFIAGAYGTGKSTLCKNLSAKIQIPAFSAGDLISKENGEKYGATKAVADKNRNQIILAQKVQDFNKSHNRIILAGHFCIFNKENNVETLPESVFYHLNIEQIILIEADTNIIIENLQKRDGKEYSSESLHRLIIAERNQSAKIARELNCKLSIYKMTFSNEDTFNVANFLM